MMNIWYGTNENAWLSNLAERRFKDGANREYVSVEHAYQTWKGGEFDDYIYSKPWEAGSKFIGKFTKKADNWNIQLMESLILASFKQNFGLWMALCLTDGGFTHTQDKGIWRREFPRILEDVRFRGFDAKLVRFQALV